MYFYTSSIPHDMFLKQTLPLKDTSLFSGLFKDYINHSKDVDPFFEFHIDKAGYDSFLKKNTFAYVNRRVLVSSLNAQADLVKNTSVATKQNIALLEKANTFTVTTGHQLCVFTGPLYFIYKIISTINLCKALQKNFPDKQFVPVYWMASEDHDFEEINHIHLFGKKLVWNSDQKGSVGEFKTEGLQEIIDELKTILGSGEHANTLIQLFEEAYLNHSNLADATRYLVNNLFGEYGLMTLDGNDHDLKQLFIKEFKEDIFEQKAFDLVNQTIDQLKKQYPVQVTPRPINVFYKDNGLRERLEQDGDRYKVVNTAISFSKEELISLIDLSPEKMSPNVVLRPLYQQKILPNVAYVGGPGEIAYWLEFKALFEGYQITLPILMPRHFILFLDKGVQGKMTKLGLTTPDLFRDGEELVKQLIKTQHADITLENVKQQLSSIFLSVTETVTQVDKSLIASTEAEKQKALNGISSIEQKINRALKQKSETDVNQIWAMKSKLFPNNIPQERYDTLSMLYSKYGKEFLTSLIHELTYDLDHFEYTVLSEH